MLVGWKNAFLRRLRMFVAPVTWRNRKVDFVIAGTHKGGTTALDRYLRRHPEICMANLKEAHYFDDDSKFARNKPNYSIYHSYFSPGPGQRVIGESTPIYMFWDSAIPRIAEYNPAMKIILCLRDPVLRAYSHWNMAKQLGNETLSFTDAVREENARRAKSSGKQQRKYSYIARSLYGGQVARILDFFPRDQLIIIRSNELRNEANLALCKVTEFLGVGEFAVESESVHSRNYDTRITDEEMEAVRGLFVEDIQTLEQATRMKFADWLAK